MDPLLKTLQDELAAEMASLTAEQLHRHPAGKWSAAEVLEHLYLTYTGTAKGFGRVLAAGKATITSVTWTQRRNLVVVLGFGRLRSGREAPSSARPRGLPVEQVIAEIAGKIGEMDDMIASCEKKLGSGKLMDHPILGPLTAAEWRKFHLVHGRHHMRQIRKLREDGI